MRNVHEFYRTLWARSSNSTPTSKCSLCTKEELLKKKKKRAVFFFFLTNGHEITGWHLPLRVIPVRLLHVRIQTAPSINGRPKINVAWKLCSETVTAQFKVWPSENGGVRWKNYFMPCTKANNTVQRDFQLISFYIWNKVFQNIAIELLCQIKETLQRFLIYKVISIMFTELQFYGI